MVKTLLIGLGGLGGRIVSQLRNQAEPMLAEKEYDLYFTAIDKDDADLSEIAHIPTVNMQLREGVKAYIEKYDTFGAADWCKVPPYESHACYGAGMRRPVGRLAFLDAMQELKLTRWLDEAIRRLRWTWEPHEDLRVVVVTSLTGGTGSGAFLQLALWIRKYLQKVLNTNCKIYGYFILPEVFIHMSEAMQSRVEQCRQMRANAYAALRELEQITNIKTGAATPEERICLDGLFDSAEPQDGVPVYDRIYLYDGQGSGEPTEADLQTHVDRIANVLYCKFVSAGADRLCYADDQLVPLSTTRDGLDFHLMGAAVARYPKYEIVEYCTLRAAREWVLGKRSTAEDIRRCESYAGKVEAYIKNLQKNVEVEIDETRLPELKWDGVVEKEALWDFVQEMMGSIKHRTAQLNSAVSYICHRVMDRTAYMVPVCEDLGPGVLNSLLMQNNSRGEPVCVAPETAYGLLQELQVYLQEKLAGSLKTEDISLLEPGPVFVDFGKKNVEPQQDLEYPLAVLRQNDLRRIMFGKGFCKTYLKWFRAYCEWYMQQQRYNAVVCVMRELCQEILRQAKMQCDCMEQLDEGIAKLLDAASAGVPTANADVLLAADDQTKDALFAKVPPMEDMSQIYGRYFTSIREHLQDVPAFASAGNDRWIRNAYNGMLECLRGHLLRNAADVLDLDPIRALLTEHGIAEHSSPGEPNAQEAQRCIEDLCRKLYALASENMYPVCETTGRKVAMVGVPRDSAYLSMVHNCLAVLYYTDLEREYSCYRNQIWCIAEAYGGKLHRIPKMHDATVDGYADAYRLVCLKAPMSFEAHMDPKLRPKEN